MGPLTLLLEHIGIVVGVLLAAVSVVLILTQRRSPQSAVAWLVSIVLVPYLAVPVFLLLGFRKQGRRLPSIEFLPMPELTDRPVTARVFHRLGAPGASEGNTFDLHDGPDDARRALEQVIDSATTHLDVLFYILEPDESGRWFVEKLTERAAAGVKVRVLLDSFGSFVRPRRALAELRAAGAELRYSSPFLHPVNRAHLNLRNHRKMVIADCTRTWSGGRNVGNAYLSSPGWTDLSFSLAGPAVQSFLDVFANDWANAAREVPAAPVAMPDRQGSAVLQLVAAGPDEPSDALHGGLVQAIHAAQTRVWVATPYFVPTEVLAHALATTARRGVDVRLLVPARSNKKVTDFARGAYLREMTRAGATVLRMPGGMLHAKMGVIDDAAWVGTANFDVRSMLLNFETVLFAYDPSSVARLADWFETQSDGAAEGMPDVALWQRLLEGVFRLGSPIL